MIFSIFVILAVALIAYLHYVQGLLNGLISMVLAIVAAMLALSYFEPMATSLSGGKYNDQSQGFCLLALFTLIYLIGRIVFDKVVSGNVRIPHLFDSIGGAVLGAVAGIFATGIVAIAIQSMPFGPVIAGYSRYPVEENKEVNIPNPGSVQAMTRVVYNPLKNNDLEKEAGGLILPVDDIVLSFAKRLSNGGSLAGDMPLEQMHPDLPQEYFGQRLGIETGGKHTAGTKDGNQAQVTLAYQINVPLPRTPSEYSQVYKAESGKLAAPNGQKLVAITVMFNRAAADEDSIVRLSPGAIRLVTKTADGWKNNYPLGTVQTGQAWVNRPDDSLFIDLRNEERGGHFLFLVDDAALVSKTLPTKPGAAPPEPAFAFAPETLLEVKRTTKIQLDGFTVTPGLPPDELKYFPMRKSAFFKEDAKLPTTASTSPFEGMFKDQGWDDASLATPKATIGNTLPVRISAGPADGKVDSPAVKGRTVSRQFDQLQVDPTNAGAAPLALPKGGDALEELFVPAGKQMVQISMSVKDSAGWDWAAKPAQYTLGDSGGNEHKPMGVLAIALLKPGSEERFMAQYDAAAELPAVKPVKDTELRSVTLIYLIPKDQKPKEMRFKSKTPGLPLTK